MLRRIALIGLTLGALGALGTSWLVWHTYEWADQPLAMGEVPPGEVYLQFAPGRTFGSLARELQSMGLLNSSSSLWRFMLLGKLTQQETRLKSGEYRITQGMTPRTLLAKMVAGEVVVHEVRIIEGVTVAQTLDELRADSRLHDDGQLQDADQLLTYLVGHTRASDTQLPGFTGDSAEGLLFPDTYQITRGVRLTALLERAYAAMHFKVMQAWGQRDEALAITSPYELLILASIIEKETGLAEDRADISQVFHNRLRLSMMLQTDPTVIYALGDAFDGNLTRAHLRMDSPYNTYRNRGLPPTPIALPSAAALQAAAHPSKGEYLYFVASGDGGSIFSQTLAEHNAAVRRYQLGQQ
jgi:UPF0755 protein